MRYAVDTPQFGAYANPRLLAELAREAEDAGWDAFFLWDHIQVGWPEPVANPWIALAAMAVATERILLGPMVTLLFRRRPWQVAREAVTLDHLSGGRVVLGVGLGDDVFGEIEAFDGPASARTRAEMLDESLAIITGLWSGERFSFRGRHYRVNDTQFLPVAVQRPRIPIWVAGSWPHKAPFRRAARFEGVVPISGDLEHPVTPAQVREMLGFIGAHRKSGAPFAMIQTGETSGEDEGRDRALVASYAQAGASWWFESPLPWKTPLEKVRIRIRQGPPRVD